MFACAKTNLTNFTPRSFNQKQCYSKAVAPQTPKSTVDWSKIQVPLQYTGHKGNMARALLITAHENGLVDQVREDLNNINNNFVNPSFRNKITLGAAKEDCPSFAKTYSHPTRILLHELYERKKLKDISYIAKAYDKLAKTLKNEVYVTVTAAKEADLKNVHEQITTALNSVGKTANIILTTKVDPSLIGGYIIEYDDFCGDFSVKSMLSHYKDQKKAKADTLESSRIDAFKRDLEAIPQSNTIFKAHIQQIEQSFYNRYARYATEEDMIVDEAAFKVSEDTSAETRRYARYSLLHLNEKDD